MTLFKLRLPATDLAAGRCASTLLTELPSPVALAVTLFENKPAGFIVEAYYDGEPAAGLIKSALASLGIDLEPSNVEAVPDANWVAISQAALPPVTAGRFIVHGSHDRARFALRRHSVEIEAGEAFGTGHSATTAGCLEALDHMARHRFRCARILDIGCGTGVLAIAAARLYPQAKVLASDSDPVAIAVARANVRLNRVAARVRVIEAQGFAHPDLRASPPFDIVLGNILPGPLVEMAPAMHQLIRVGGVAILSGLLREQAREVRATYGAAGFHVLRPRHLEEWTILTLQRRH